jgi:hypothetical protein
MRILELSGMPASKIGEIVRVLLWYGVLGLKSPDGSVTYICNVNYEMPILAGIIRKLEPDGLMYLIDPAFVPGLQLQGQRDEYSLGRLEPRFLARQPLANRVLIAGPGGSATENAVGSGIEAVSAKVRCQYQPG